MSLFTKQVRVLICRNLMMFTKAKKKDHNEDCCSPALLSKIKNFFLVHSVQVSIWYVKYGREESMDICMLCIKQDERNKGLGGLLVSQVNQSSQPKLLN